MTPIGWQIGPSVSLCLQLSISNPGTMSTEQNQRETGLCLHANSHCSRPISITGAPFFPRFTLWAASICCTFFISFPFWTIWCLSPLSLRLPGVLMTNHHTLFLSFKAWRALENVQNLFLILHLPKHSWGNNTSP